MISHIDALQTVADRQRVTAEKIEKLLNSRKTAKVRLRAVTQQKLASAHRGMLIHRVCEYTMQLFTDSADAAKVYNRNIASFESTEIHFNHSPCYCVAKHNAQQKDYLYGNILSASSAYVKNGQILSVDEVAPLCTRSGEATVRSLDEKYEPIENNKGGKIKTISLNSIVSIELL